MRWKRKLCSPAPASALKGHAFAGVLALPPSITMEGIHQERGCYHVLGRSTTIMWTLTTPTDCVDFLSTYRTATGNVHRLITCPQSFAFRLKECALSLT